MVKSLADEKDSREKFGELSQEEIVRIGPEHVMLLMEEIVQQVIGSLSPYLQDFIHPQGGAAILPSTAGHEHVIVEINFKLGRRFDA